MKKLCTSALVLVLTLSVFTGCGCTNRRNPTGMMPTDMTIAPTTVPTTAPTTTPTEEMTMPTMDMTEATGNMMSDPTDTMDNSAPMDNTDSTETTGTGRSRAGAMR